MLSNLIEQGSWKMLERVTVAYVGGPTVVFEFVAVRRLRGPDPLIRVGPITGPGCGLFENSESSLRRRSNYVCGHSELRT